HYCGTEYQDETAPCFACGTPPAASPDRVKAEPGASVLDSGLLDCAVGLAAIAAGHAAGVIHVVAGLFKPNSPAEENSPHRLLERAAAQESVNMYRAIALYKQIALNHPGTRAAKEANRNLQTLRAVHPELEDSPVASPKQSFNARDQK